MTSTTRTRDPHAIRHAIEAGPFGTVATIVARFARRAGAEAGRIRQSGQLGVSRETEIGRWTGGRV
jgi:hypothetical protein